MTKGRKEGRKEERRNRVSAGAAAAAAAAVAAATAAMAAAAATAAMAAAAAAAAAVAAAVAAATAAMAAAAAAAAAAADQAAVVGFKTKRAGGVGVAVGRCSFRPTQLEIPVSRRRKKNMYLVTKKNFTRPTPYTGSDHTRLSLDMESRARCGCIGGKEGRGQAKRTIPRA